MDIIANIDWMEVIGWLGNMGFLLGAIDLAKLRRTGWLWQMYGNWAYVIVGLEKQLFSLICLDGILFIVNVIGWFKWRKFK